jgi:hypothetical protein
MVHRQFWLKLLERAWDGRLSEATASAHDEIQRLDDHAFAAGPAMVSPSPLIVGLRGGPS